MAHLQITKHDGYDDHTTTVKLEHLVLGDLKPCVPIAFDRIKLVCSGPEDAIQAFIYLTATHLEGLRTRSLDPREWNGDLDEALEVVEELIRMAALIRKKKTMSCNCNAQGQEPSAPFDALHACPRPWFHPWHFRRPWTLHEEHVEIIDHAKAVVVGDRVSPDNCTYVLICFEDGTETPVSPKSFDLLPDKGPGSDVELVKYHINGVRGTISSLWPASSHWHSSWNEVKE